MPRPADPLIRKEILDASERLLERGSEQAVTMRAVAEETGIAVTTIYERFDGREGLLRELTVHFADEEAKKLAKWKTIEEVFDHYLDFAQAHPHRYKMLADSFFERLGSGAPMPGFDLTKRMLAKRLGGRPGDYEELGLGVVQLLSGTVTAMTMAGEKREYQTKAKRAAKAALRRMLVQEDRNI